MEDIKTTGGVFFSPLPPHEVVVLDRHPDWGDGEPQQLRCRHVNSFIDNLTDGGSGNNCGIFFFFFEKPK